MVDLHRIGVSIMAEASRKGATAGTCAGLYAVALGSVRSCDGDFWGAVNSALCARWGPKGRERVKKTAWLMYDNAAAAMLADGVPA
jgi:hypothetical protein